VTDRIQIGNVGRGYVLKRILRRGVRFGKQFLHLPDGFFARLVSVVIKMYGSAFPELIAEGNEKYVTTSVAEEENAFLANWVQGEQQFLKIVERVKKSGSTVIPGEDAAFLYQTGGFPVDLTRIMAEDAGMTVDEKGFEAAQKRHVEASKGETKVGDGSTKTIVLETAHMAVLNKEMKIPGTDDSVKYDLGEDGKAVSSKIQAMFDGSSFMDEISEGQNIGIVMEVTPFYAEQGGQVSDVGFLTSTSGAKLEILDCKKYGEYTLHQGVVRSGSFKVGDSIEASVDMTVRNAILPNHTMTHVLNLGLRNVLPQDQVDQKGMYLISHLVYFFF
jgi:alanyl-tRNA synthetase